MMQITAHSARDRTDLLEPPEPVEENSIICGVLRPSGSLGRRKQLLHSLFHLLQLLPLPLLCPSPNPRAPPQPLPSQCSTPGKRKPGFRGSSRDAAPHTEGCASGGASLPVSPPSRINASPPGPVASALGVSTSQ